MANRLTWDTVRPLLQNVKECHDGGFLASCPCPDHGQGNGDEHPSLSIKETGSGTLLLNCFAGCTFDEIRAALIGESPSPKGIFVSVPLGNTAQPQRSKGCSLAEYADSKKLPVDFLKEVGVTEKKEHGETPYLRMPYYHADGTEGTVRFRKALHKSGLKGDNRFQWYKGKNPLLYGLNRLNESQKDKDGYVVLVEGESDSQTLWYHSIPALGVPGARAWKADWAKHLESFQTIYLVVEPDKGGEALKTTLSHCGAIRERLHFIRLGNFKDASDLHVDDPDLFKERWEQFRAESISWTDYARVERQASVADAWEECKGIATNPSLLDDFYHLASGRGLVGEERLAKVLYLMFTSRVLDKPVSVLVKGASSTGKSHTGEQVAAFFPKSAYYPLSASSEKALAYGNEELSHRILVIFEAAGMGSDFATYLLRTMLSEGRIRYETVEKSNETGGMAVRVIEREGPMGLLMTTTSVSIHPENETRMLSVPTDDRSEQIKAVLYAIAERAQDGGTVPPVPGEWIALQEWIAGQDNQVRIPFALRLAEAIPPAAQRLRRDMSQLLGLIKSHAILHQATREKDKDGFIVATLDDYEAVRPLVSDLMAEGIKVSVSSRVRDAVHAVITLNKENNLQDGASVIQVAAKMGCDKAAASNHVKAALHNDFLVNDEIMRGKPAKLRRGPVDLPTDDTEILPTVESLKENATI